MSNTTIEKILNIWKSENNIQKPNKSEDISTFVHQIASLFAAGSCYYFVYNLYTFKFDLISDSVKEVLGIEPEVFSLQKLSEVVHPEDFIIMEEREKTSFNFLLKTIKPEEVPLYKTVYMYRYKHLDGEYKTILHQSRVINTTEEGKIQQVLCIHTDVSYLNIPFSNKMSFISDSLPCYHYSISDNKYHLVDITTKKQLTHREKEIVKKLSEGYNFNEIAKALFVSPHTINTHKKNILKKVGCKNTTELVAQCIREGII